MTWSWRKRSGGVGGFQRRDEHQMVSAWLLTGFFFSFYFIFGWGGFLARHVLIVLKSTLFRASSRIG
jgi:hypothetical protein